MQYSPLCNRADCTDAAERWQTSLCQSHRKPAQLLCLAWDWRLIALLPKAFYSNIKDLESMQTTAG